MTPIYSWSARRAGGRITVSHSCGKVPHVDTIAPDAEGRVIATAADGREYVLVVQPHRA